MKSFYKPIDEIKAQIERALPVYKSMTIRSWNTTTKLLELLRKKDAEFASATDS